MALQIGTPARVAHDHDVAARLGTQVVLVVLLDGPVTFDQLGGRVVPVGTQLDRCEVK